MTVNYTVYLSSTLKDLEDERKAVREALSDECIVKHSYRASEKDLVTSCLADVAECDAYILILGMRYGYVPQVDLQNPHNLSITELEYEHAIDKPRFVFIKDEESIPFAQTDAKTKEHPLERIENFRTRVSEQRPAVFKTAEELKLAVVKAFNKFKEDRAKRAAANAAVPQWVSLLTKEGVESRLSAVHPVELEVPALKDMLAVSINVDLDGPGEQKLACTVGVPSVAVNGQVVLYTGNWYSAVSTDGGHTFRYMDPFAAFAAADPPNSHFSCNQVVQYISQIDTFVWLLQYGPDTASNLLRLAFAKTRNVVSRQWYLFDITPECLGLEGANLDHPDLAVGANFLYVSTNIFREDQVCAAVVRIPFDSIESGRPKVQIFISSEMYGLRVAQNCGMTAFFAAHETTSTLCLCSWEEGQSVPKVSSVPVARWIGGYGYESETPDGRKWLDRIDPRITGAALAADELWFAWTVDRGTDQRPNPFVRIARIGTRDFRLIENMSVFDAHSAICYPALSTNGANEVGITCAIGGGDRFPSHLIGILTGPRQAILAAAGDRAPIPDPQTGRGEWGSYLTVRPVFPGRKLFAAAGYTLKGKKDGANRDATPRLVIYGRSGEVASDSELQHPT